MLLCTLLDGVKTIYDYLLWISFKDSPPKSLLTTLCMPKNEIYVHICLSCLGEASIIFCLVEV
jgi:hypothetical protein